MKDFLNKLVNAFRHLMTKTQSNYDELKILHAHSGTETVTRWNNLRVKTLRLHIWNVTFLEHEQKLINLITSCKQRRLNRPWVTVKSLNFINCEHLWNKAAPCETNFPENLNLLLCVSCWQCLFRENKNRKTTNKKFIWTGQT